MDRRKGKSFIISSVLLIAIFWMIGFAMLIFRQLSVIHIPGWIIWLQFLGPYSLLIMVFAVVILRMALSGKTYKRKDVV